MVAGDGLMQNIHVTAHLSMPIAIQSYLPLDGLLISLEAARMMLPPPEVQFVEISIPLLMHERGFYHASFGRGKALSGGADQQWRRRRFALREASLLTDGSIKKVPQDMGPLKAINLPSYLRSIPLIEWWCVGDLEWVRSTLANCLGLGSGRGRGFGHIERWEVEACEEDWSLFYPCDSLGQSRPARALPPDLPELRGKAYDTQLEVPTPPYWQRERACLCAVPERIG